MAKRTTARAVTPIAAVTTASAALAVAINLATDNIHNPWGWSAVLGFTVLSAAATFWQVSRSSDDREADAATSVIVSNTGEAMAENGTAISGFTGTAPTEGSIDVEGTGNAKSVGGDAVSGAWLKRPTSQDRRDDHERWKTDD